jgi:outer membrane protein assembly factor BamA
MESRPSTLFTRTLFSYFKVRSDKNVLENFYRSEGFLNPSVNIKVSMKSEKNG